MDSSNLPSRRTVLGTAGAIGLGTAVGTTVPAHAAGSPGEGPAFDTAPARSALNRLLPDHAGQFRLTPLRPSGGRERFRVTGTTGRVEVAGTSPRCCSTGRTGT